MSFSPGGVLAVLVTVLAPERLRQSTWDILNQSETQDKGGHNIWNSSSSGQPKTNVSARTQHIQRRRARPTHTIKRTEFNDLLCVRAVPVTRGDTGQAEPAGDRAWNRRQYHVITRHNVVRFGQL
ncbi:hypothetical protein BDY19DRAFT_908852 [Irpex rosettiformis]|uniref:Uncharacterized protein n=1 Tax=Irpex rosettiformis TaxID=378272 RepID=A0ACB8TUZ5_9APHY|nr:hypothetical protein BDY19DRAFT_908852 [Irpex rosettiformis]